MSCSIAFDEVSQLFSGPGKPDTVALRNLTFDVAKNEFLAIVGQSGCGKSTILRLNAGLIAPSKGRVLIDDFAVTGPPDLVGIVFQKPTLLPWLNVIDNVLFPVRHKFGPVTEENRRQASKLLELVGLADFAKSRPHELSGGMQQRAAIARALLLDPEIMLMDEPFSALDALTRDEMSFELLRICAERPKTVIFITHSINEAVLLSDRIIVMTPRPGTVLEIIDNPLERPRSLETLSQPEFIRLANKLRMLISHKPTAAN